MCFVYSRQQRWTVVNKAMCGTTDNRQHSCMGRGRGADFAVLCVVVSAGVVRKLILNVEVYETLLFRKLYFDKFAAIDEFDN